MEIRFQNLGPEHWKAQLLIAPAFEGEKIHESVAQLDKCCPWLAISPAATDFTGKDGQFCVCHGHPDLAVPRVILCGLGKKADFTLAKLRKTIAGAVRKARDLGLKSILLPQPVLALLPGNPVNLLQEAVYAAQIGLYRFTELKTATADLPPDPEWLAIGFDSGSTPDADQAAARKGEMDAWAVALARNLDNLPGNLLYPEALALKCAELAHKFKIKCSILDENALYEQNMGCLLAVGSGSAHPPRLISLEYVAKGHENERPLLLVGKGITFDSGGLCLKPAANMYQMKSDMSGAAAVLAVISAVAQEEVPCRLVCILACAENMPDGRAYRPGDVLNSANGMSVEVRNTDAEGRLALCDALAYAQKNWQPRAIIDIATLTGACAVALGNDLAGLFCDDEELASQIEAFGAATGENFWRLPLWPAYEKALKSEIADICHTASREGGAITAALFLKKFIAHGQKWAHLDIAGVDWQTKKSPLCPEGPTAFGVRSLLALSRGGAA